MIIFILVSLYYFILSLLLVFMKRKEFIEKRTYKGRKRKRKKGKKGK